jgi:DNA gyrase subunit A
VGRRYARVDEGDRIVLVRLVGEETGVMLASRGGHIIHFPVEEVSILSGVGKGVMGIKLDDGDVCVGGVLVGGRFDKLVVETESGKQQDFGPGAIKVQKRGGHGAKPGARTRFTAVVPTDIELVNWDEIEDKTKNGKPTNGSPRLFE